MQQSYCRKRLVGLTTFPGASGPRDFGIPPGAPALLKDYTIRDTPMIGLHIITFQDATLLTITWPHVLFDAVGFSHLIQAWSAVLAGHKERVPNIISAQDDVLYELGRITHAGPHPSDAILAWLSRALVSSSKTPRSISMTTPIDARTRLSQLQNMDGVYVQNMILGSFVNIAPDDIRGSLGKQALVSRRGLLQQLDELSLIGILQLFRKRWDDGKTREPIFAGPGGQLLVTNNRLKVDLFTVADFGPAVIRAGKDQQRNNHPGRPVHHYASALNPGITMRNFVNIHTRDFDGNYWLSGFFTPRQWLRIEEGFRELQ
ncbi:hypothetical protein FBULB1_6901 [Fusarium bulbicola]|nr:hypothetical protein FBULB1_6901 [Fusarium bulbicola]